MLGSEGSVFFDERQTVSRFAIKSASQRGVRSVLSKNLRSNLFATVVDGCGLREMQVGCLAI